MPGRLAHRIHPSTVPKPRRFFHFLCRVLLNGSVTSRTKRFDRHSGLNSPRSTSSTQVPRPYRGRLAPSPTGYLHLGHARTFWTAQRRAQAHAGTLVLRNEDLDRARCRPEFVSAMLEDLAWFGFRWQEGPDVGGRFAPYNQSERQEIYRVAFQRLKAGGFVYPCRCSRQDVLRALQAPHSGEDEPIYPGTCRPTNPAQHAPFQSGLRVNWRF